MAAEGFRVSRFRCLGFGVKGLGWELKGTLASDFGKIDPRFWPYSTPSHPSISYLKVRGTYSRQIPVEPNYAHA